MSFELTPEYLASQGLSQTFPVRFWAKVNKNGPVPAHRPELGSCWIWTGFQFKNNGYGQAFARWKNGKTHLILAHVASWILHFGDPDELCVLHHCDNRPCVNPIHLWRGTYQDNSDDMDAKGRRSQIRANGQNHGMAILTENQVLEIRKRYAVGHVEQTQLANEFHVSIACIHSIVRRKSWKHLSTLSCGKMVQSEMELRAN
jgi:hypothetical protein